MAKHRGKYADGHVRIAEKLHARGSVGLVFITELAIILGVSTNTIWHWTLVHPDFRDAVDAAFADPVDQVEASIFRRALGYSFESEKIDIIKMRETDYEDGKPVASRDTIETVRTPFIEHVPPDINAQRFILTNLRNRSWRERRAVEVTGKDGAPIAVEDRTAGAVDRLIRALADRQKKMIDVTPVDPQASKPDE